jgi:hypothetical protein
MGKPKLKIGEIVTLKQKKEQKGVIKASLGKGRWNVQWDTIDEISEHNSRSLCVFVIDVPDLPDVHSGSSSSDGSDQEDEENAAQLPNRDAEFKKKRKQFENVSKNLTGTVIQVIYYLNIILIYLIFIS